MAMAFTLLVTGCAVNSGNLTANVKSSDYIHGKDAVVIKETIHTDVDGGTTTDITTVTKTGPQVGSELDHHKLDVVDHVGVARAKGRFQSWLDWLSTPGYCNNNGYGGYYSGGGGGYITSGSGGGYIR